MAKIDWSKVKVMSSKDIPPGATRFHLYEFSDVLRPRGTMKKESLGISIAEKLLSYYKSWTKLDYGDNPDQETLLKVLQKNLTEEVGGAWSMFLHCVETGEDPWDVVYKKSEDES